MDKSSTYCVLPHIGMALQNHADFCVCNINKASWKDQNRQVMHVHTHPAKLSFQSHTRKMIGASLDHGIKHPSCKVCWDLEETGVASPRQNYNKMFADVEPLLNQPRVLIIKPGNTCNFACRMCNPITSSSWYADGYDLERNGIASSSWYNDEHSNQTQAMTFNEYTRTFETVRNSFNRDNEDFWGTMKEWIENLVFIDIYGGEPFLTPALFDLLEHGVKIGAAKNIKLNIHTNASIYNQNYLDILSHYKLVQFSVSLDSHIPAQLEYIRHKADFDQVVQNTNKFKQYTDKINNIKMGITCTITPFNVYYIDDIVNNLQNMFMVSVNRNIVTTPEYDIRHLPLSVKSYLVQNITEPLTRGFLQKNIPGCDIEWPKFCRATDRLDQLRDQSFADTFPEWWDILKPYWIKI